MSVDAFFIGLIVLTIIAVGIVSYEAIKGRDWRTCSMFMLIGWMFAVGQLASTIK